MSTPVPAPASQSTAIEQSRAVAEVQAAVVIAQERPRSVPAALTALDESCRQLPLAQVAWYRYSRAGSQVSDISIHLAREIARCWGNVQYGISELDRDDVTGRSEMRAWAWDLQTNTMVAQNFIVPHARDTKSGRKLLVELRDVYENNANMGARRVREAILAVVPRWYSDHAKDVCHDTLERGDSDKPLGRRVADAIRGFDALHVSQLQLETKLGRKSGVWTPGDLATLTVIYSSLQRSETTVDDEFPPERVTAEEIAAPPPPATPAPTGDPVPASDPPAPVQATSSYDDDAWLGSQGQQSSPPAGDDPDVARYHDEMQELQRRRREDRWP